MPSPAWKDKLIHGGMRPDDVHVIPNGVDQRLYRPADGRLSAVLTLLTLRRPPPYTRFPYTTLFRSLRVDDLQHDVALDALQHVAADDRLFLFVRRGHHRPEDRKSTRLNSSHLGNSYAVSCLERQTDPRRHASRRRPRHPERRRPAALPARRRPPFRRAYVAHAPAPPAVHALSLHDALPISACRRSAA